MTIYGSDRYCMAVPCEVCGGPAYGCSDLCSAHKGYEPCTMCDKYWLPDELDGGECDICRHECAVYCGECGEPLDECDGSLHEQANAPEAPKAPGTSKPT